MSGAAGRCAKVMIAFIILQWYVGEDSLQDHPGVLHGEIATMTSAASRLRIAESNGVTNIEFVDRNILDEANIQQIGEEIARIVESQSDPKLLISFENVDHLSSSALGTLITINNKVRAKDGQLRLSNIDQQIYEVFVITKLNTVFEIHDTVDEAMKSFS